MERLLLRRREGRLRSAVTALLAADARERGAQTVFLFANNEHAERIYVRLGFRRLATAVLAEPEKNLPPNHEP